MKFKEWLEKVKKGDADINYKSSLSYYSSQEIELYEFIFNSGVKEGSRDVKNS